jgi:hypothetical protein
VPGLERVRIHLEVEWQISSSVSQQLAACQ